MLTAIEDERLRHSVERKKAVDFFFNKPAAVDPFEDAVKSVLAKETKASKEKEEEEE